MGVVVNNGCSSPSLICSGTAERDRGRGEGRPPANWRGEGEGGGEGGEGEDEVLGTSNQMVTDFLCMAVDESDYPVIV